MLAAFPLLALPVALYNVLMLTGGGAGQRLTAPIAHLRLASKADWTISLSDLILAGSLVILFAELLRSAGERNAAIINHGLSLMLFVLCLIEFLLLPTFATSTFFLLGLMVLLDAVAGFTMTFVSPRREPPF
jgi:hypothetical protein